MMNDISRRRFEELKAGGSLPSPRGVALAVLDLTGRPNASAREITRLVQIDPAMAGRILRYANGAHGGGLRHIVSLSHAITFLGLFRVRQIALGFSLIDQYRSGACVAFDYAGYWTSALATGIAAQKLAHLAQCPPDESFSCGLLAGIGRLALATAFPDKYAVILRQGLSGTRLADEERARFGVDHAQLSSEMLDSWGLPEIFTHAVRDHEYPAQTPSPPGTRAHALCASLHFAMRIGQLLNLDDAHRWEQVPSLFNAGALLGMGEEDVPPLVEAVVAEWQGWARELNLPTRSYSDLRELLAAPPSGTHEGEESAPGIAPLHVMLLAQDQERHQALARLLNTMGLRVDRVVDLADAQAILHDNPPDVAIMDTGSSDGNAMARLRELRKMAGTALHIIALIPADAEPRVALLIRAGAADYLLYDCTEAALIARLSNAQRLVSLQVVVRAEREMAVNSSGEWARANRRLLHVALTDPLTQLPNRRYGLDQFAEEWNIASSNDLPIACLMLDIDHFKRVNDQRGHGVGDLVLRQVATVIERCCRRSDIVFRYGGEEFCGICPGTATTEAIQLGERIAAAVRGERYGLPDDLFEVTLSIGVAVREQSMSESSKLMEMADRALYAAKERGRNRVVSLQQQAT